MIYYKTSEEIEMIRASCLLVSKTLAHVASIIKPGVTGKQIDDEAEQLIRDHKAVPGFKGYNGFPATLCISPNEGIVHGIPTNKEFQEGDVVSIDCGALLNGYFGDSAYTFPLGEVSDEVSELLRSTNKSLYLGIEQAIIGNRIGDIGYAIQHFIEKEKGYSIVRELVGHGIGKNLHEAPEVPNYGLRGKGQKMKKGLVIAIEPMVNLGSRDIRQSDDGWTIITKDRKPSAHFEHTIAVGESAADILSDHSFIELAIKNNPNIHDISIKS